jgi:acetyl esterase/lipase
MKPLFPAAVCFTFMAVCLADDVKPKSSPILPANIRVERDVAYLPEGRMEKADLYFPAKRAGKAKLPLVVVIHGGGWVGGRRNATREINICGTLARNGYAAMSIDYMLSIGQRAVWPTNLWDCKTAVRWARKNADRLGIDPDRIGVLGGSAGGHLAAMTALTAPADGFDPAEPYGDISCHVKCCVDFYGIADAGAWHDTAMLGRTMAEAPELYRRASPIHYVRSASPPFLILHGTADTTVNIKQSELLAQTLQDAGVEQQLVIIPGGQHSFDLQPPQRDLRPVVLGFLDQYLISQTDDGQSRDSFRLKTTGNPEK